MPGGDTAFSVGRQSFDEKDTKCIKRNNGARYDTCMTSLISYNGNGVVKAHYQARSGRSGPCPRNGVSQLSLEFRRSDIRIICAGERYFGVAAVFASSWQEDAPCGGCVNLVR